MAIITRAQWGARSPIRSYEKVTSTKGVKIHYTGDEINPRIIDDHSMCYTKVHSIQNHHMDNNGWNDIGYNLLVCPHRYTFIGRGPFAIPAANGPGLNTAHYAICGLVGTIGFVKPNNDLYNGLKDAILWIRNKGNAGNEVKRHMDGYNTDCPGKYLSDWVVNGANYISVLSAEKEVNEMVAMRYIGTIPSGETNWPVSIHPPDLKAIGFWASTRELGTEQGLNTIELSVEVHDKNGFYTEQVVIGIDKPKPWFFFRDPASTNGIVIYVKKNFSNVPIAWDMS